MALHTAAADFLAATPDLEWDRDCLSYSVIAPVIDDAAHALTAAQRAVAEMWPAPLHLCPGHSFHVTVCSPAGVRVHFDKERYWQDHGEHGLAALGEVCATRPPFDVVYTRIVVSSSAIIAIAEDDGSMQSLRRAVAETFPPSPVPVAPPDIIHTTLARHASARPVPRAIVEKAMALPIRIAMTVSQLSVVRERVYPLLAADRLTSVPLAITGARSSPR